MINPTQQTENLAFELYENKLKRPQYKAYTKDKDLQKLLFSDCLREALASERMCGK